MIIPNLASGTFIRHTFWEILLRSPVFRLPCLPTGRRPFFTSNISHPTSCNLLLTSHVLGTHRSGSILFSSVSHLPTSTLFLHRTSDICHPTFYFLIPTSHYPSAQCSTPSANCSSPSAHLLLLLFTFYFLLLPVKSFNFYFTNTWYPQGSSSTADPVSKFSLSSSKYLRVSSIISIIL